MVLAQTVFRTIHRLFLSTWVQMAAQSIDFKQSEFIILYGDHIGCLFKVMVNIYISVLSHKDFFLIIFHAMKN